MKTMLQRRNQAIERSCRRRAARILMPVEVQLTSEGRTVKAVIRDASFDDKSVEGKVGICIFHNEELPLDKPIYCRMASVQGRLPDESQVSLLWNRTFGSDGYLSGGTLVPRVGTDS